MLKHVVSHRKLSGSTSLCSSATTSPSPPPALPPGPSQTDLCHLMDDLTHEEQESILRVMEKDQEMRSSSNNSSSSNLNERVSSSLSMIPGGTSSITYGSMCGSDGFESVSLASSSTGITFGGPPTRNSSFSSTTSSFAYKPSPMVSLTTT